MKKYLLLIALLFLAAISMWAQSTTFYVDDDFTSGTPGWGTTHFATIQQAINAAVDGDNINVAAGTYNESQILVNKAISVVGAGMGSSFIDGGSASIATVGLVRITAGGNVTFSDFTIQHAGGPAKTDYGDNKLNVGIYAQSGTSGVAYYIYNNKIIGTNNADDEEDYGFYSHSGKETLYFHDNTITQTGANAILLEKHEGMVEVSYNILDAGAYGIDPIFDMTYGGKDITAVHKFDHNSIDLSTGSGSGTATGISIASSFKAADNGDGKFTNIAIINNNITGMIANRRGIGLWNGSVGSGAAGDIPNAQITGNTITGVSATTSSCRGIQLINLVTGTVITDNVISLVNQCLRGFTYAPGTGIATGTQIYHNKFSSFTQMSWSGSATLNAETNYWGTTDPASILALLSGNIDVSPYCNSDLSDCTLEFTFTNETTGLSYLTLSDALNGASTGQTVAVNTPGTYGGITFNSGESVTLTNSSGDVVTFTGASPALTVTSGTLTVSGFSYTTATNDPTIVVSGTGTLNISLCTITESTAYDQSCIAVTEGGVLNAGTSGSPGHNTFITDAGGMAVTNTSTGAVDAIGNYWGGTYYFDVLSKISGTVSHDPWCNSLFNKCDYTATATGPVTTAGELVVTPAGAVTVPITVTNFNNVDAISLKIKYNPSILTFTGSSSRNSSFSWSYPPYASGGYIYISGISSPTTYPNGVTFTGTTLLLNLLFTSVTGTSLLEWTDDAGGTACEYQNALIQWPYVDSPFGTYYDNGFVTDMYVTFTRAYSPQTITAVAHNGSTNYVSYDWTGPVDQTYSGATITPTDGYGIYTVLITDDVGGKVTATYLYAPVHNTDTYFDFWTIQAAIDDGLTVNGHDITVDDYTFNLAATIRVTKEVSITGNITTPASVVINAPTAGGAQHSQNSGFVVLAGNVTIQGFRIQGALHTGTAQNAGIYIDDPRYLANPGLSNITLTKNEITNNGYGIVAQNVKNSTISYNKVYSQKKVAGKESETGVGIVAYGREEGANHTYVITIDHNDVYNNETEGIRIDVESSVGSTNFVNDLAIAISNNTVYNNGSTIGGVDKYVGIKSAGWSKGVTLTGNNIYGHMGTTISPTSSNAGIWIPASNDWEISGNNLIHGNLNGVYFLASTVDPGSGSHIINGNDIYDNVRGISIDDGAEAIAETNKIHGNNLTTFSGIGYTPYGVINRGTVMLDASPNWWGDASGPYNYPNYTCGSGDKVSLYVTFIPWCTASDCSTTGSATALNVYNTDKMEYYCKIQDAVDNANSGDDITVVAGTYTEQVSIPISLTLSGAGLASTTIQAPAVRTKSVVAGGETWDYIVAAYPATGTIDVRITGFTIDDNNKNKTFGTTELVGLFMRDVNGTNAGFFNSEIKGFPPTPEYECYGVKVYGNSALTILNNKVSGYTRDGIGVNGGNVWVIQNEVTGSGIALNGISIIDAASGCRVYKNTVKNHTRSAPWAGCGILAGINSLEVDYNTVDNCYQGIGLTREQGTVTISGLSIHHNILTGIIDHGIAMSNIANSYVYKNSFSNAAGSLNAALLLNLGSTGNTIGGISAAYANTFTVPVTGTGNLRAINLATTVGAGSNTISYNTFNGGKHVLWQDGGTSGTTTFDHNVIGDTTSPVLAGLYFDSGTLDIRSNTMTLDGTVNQGIFMNNACGNNSMIGGGSATDGNTITFAGAGTVGNQYAIQTGGADESKNFSIYYNVITGGQRGIQVDGPQATGGGGLNIVQNTINNTAYGAIISYNKKGLSITNNTLNNNARPIELFNPIAFVIADNIINGATYDAINLAGSLLSISSPITNNTISGAGGAGIRGQAGSNILSIDCNELTGCSRGIMIETGCTGTVIMNNNIHDNSYSAVELHETVTTMTGNFLTNTPAGDVRGIETSSSLTAHNNYFSGFNYGAVIFASAGTFNITDNWWNSADGPGVWLGSPVQVNQNTFNQATQGESIQANTYPNFTFAPWLTSGTDNSGNCGFQPEAGTSFAPIYANSSGTPGVETEKYASLQYANNVSALPYVYAKYGTYTERPEFSRSLTLTGLASEGNKPVIDGSASGNVVTLAANAITITGFKVQNSGATADRAGILLRNDGIGGVTGCTVTGNEIANNASGLAVILGSGNSITSNDIHNSPEYGLLLIGTDGNTVESNTISVITKDAIALDNLNAVTGDPDHKTIGSNGNYLKTNTIHTITRDGIFMGENCGGNFITNVNNIYSVGGDGIHLWRTGSETIQNNTITGCSVGIRMLGSSGNTITDNSVTGSGTGFELLKSEVSSVYYPCDNNTIQNNTISGNTMGMNALDNNGTTVIAELNWWGDKTGPYHATTNLCGTANPVTNYVDFSPWWYQSGMSTYNGLPEVTVTPMPDISTITNTPVIITMVEQYPGNLGNYDNDILVDGRITITGGTGLPANAKIISVTYDGSPNLLTGAFDLDASPVFISTILGTAPAKINGHTAATHTWVLTMTGFDVDETYTVKAENVSFITGGSPCYTSNYADEFTVTLDNATFAVSPDTYTVCYPDALIFSGVITYPVIANVNDAIKADAFISSTYTMPAGTKIKWGYDGPPATTYTLPSDAANIYLSDIVNGGTPLPLQGNTGTDTWNFEITNYGVAPQSLPLIFTVTMQPVVRLSGTNYPHTAGDNIVLNSNSCGFSGWVKYHNATSTNMNNVTVELFQGGAKVYPLTGEADVKTDANGLYSFPKAGAGTYDIHLSTVKPVAANNSTDAAQVNNWFTHQVPIEKARFFAGDVQGDAPGVPNNYVTAQDAYLIQGNFVQGLPFDRIAWCFWRAGQTQSTANYGVNDYVYPTITISTSNQNQPGTNFYGMATGDFNRSFVPGTAKSGTEHLSLTYRDNLMVNPSTVFDLPVYTTQALEAGAASVILNFPADLVELTGVSMNLGGALDWAVNGDELRIGWNTLAPVSMAAGEEMFRINLRSTADFTGGKEIRFRLADNILNELADGAFESIPLAVLAIDVASATAYGIDENISSSGILLSNRPNPFRDYTEIMFSLPFEGRATLEVYNAIGNRVDVLVDELRAAGSYTFEYLTGSLSPGVYTATLKLQGDGQVIMKTMKIVKTK